MTIHHATVKSAATKGVILSIDGEGLVEAKHAETGATIWVLTQGDENTDHTEAAKVAFATVLDVRDWHIEHPGYKVSQSDEELSILNRTSGDQVCSVDDLNDMDDAWATLKADFDEATDGEAGTDEAEEDEDRGSCVPSGFKALYKEIGVRHQDNGDFLASIMAAHTIILDGKAEVIDVDKVEALGSRNGVEYPVSGYGPAITSTRGWQGRYRMTVGNMLRKRIADAGVCYIPASLTRGEGEQTATPPQAWIDKNKTKVRAKVAKEDKAAAEAIAAPKAKRAKKAK